MRTKLTAIVLVLTLMGGAGCAGWLSQHPPILNPQTAVSVTNALASLKSILQARNVDPAVIAAITDAQTFIAADISGETWGEILRELMTNLYSQVPLSVQNDPVVWAVFAGIEVALATIGA